MIRFHTKLYLYGFCILLAATHPSWAADESDNVEKALQDLTADPNINSPEAESDAPLSGTSTESPDNNSVTGNGADASTASEDTESTSEATTETGTAQAATEEPIPHVVPNPGFRRIQEVLKHLDLFQRDQEVIKFGNEETTLSGLYLPENTGTPQGGILILHDIEEHAHWPQTVGPLREYLPDYGWNTLSLFFEDYLQSPKPGTQKTKKPDSIPQADENQPDDVATAQADITDELESDTENETTEPDELEDQNFIDDPTDSLAEIADSLDELPKLNSEDKNLVAEEPELSIEDQFLKDMQLRVEDGLRQLNTLGQFNLVIIAHGLSANWAAATLNERFKKTPGVKGYALVLVNAKASQYPLYQLDEQLAKLHIPMLDIVTTLKKGEERMMINRRNAITRKQNRQYIQIKLPEIHTNLKGKKNMITRRVRGWLKTHAAGQEVAIKSTR